MKNKLWKELIVAVLLISTILSFSPVAYGETTSVQQSIDAVKMEMKQAASAYVEPALKGELVSSASLDAVLNSVKKNYEATKKLILASNLSEKEKQAKLKELEALYEEKIVKGLIPYIDAYNYATKYLEPLLKEIKEAEAKNDFLAVEKAYHKLSVQLKSRTAILYRFSGKVARDLMLEKYKNLADRTRDEMIVPVTIIMKLTSAQQLFQTGKVEEVKRVLEDIQTLVAELTVTNPFHQALIKELERLQAIFFPTPVPPASNGGGGDSSETSAQRALRIAKTNALKELKDYKEDVKAEYSATSWTSIEGLKEAGKIAINSSKTPTDVTKALDNAKAEVDKVLTEAQELALALEKAKADAITVLSDYKMDVKADYSAANWAEIEKGKATGVIAINSSKTPTEVTKALVDAKAEVDKVLTEAQELALALVKAKADAIKALSDYKVDVKADYSSVNWAEIEKRKATGVSAINLAKTPTDVTKALVDAKAEVDKVLTEAQELALALVKAKADAITVLSDYKVDVKADYSAANWAEIEKGKADGKIAIDAATTTTEVTDAINAAKAKIDNVPIKSNVSTVSGITVKGEVAIIDTTDSTSRSYKVILPSGTDPTTLTSAHFTVITTDPNAKVGQATTMNKGATWQVIVTPEDGKSTTTYTINVTVNTAPTIANPIPDQNGKVGNAVTLDLSNVFTDADNESLTFTANIGTVTGTTWSYTPVAGDAGQTITVTLSAEDGIGDSVQDTFTVKVSPTVKLTIDSFGTAGDREITGLPSDGTYSVMLDGTRYEVLSNGSLSKSGSAQPLQGTKIIGLDNTKSYKVFDSRLKEATPTEIKVGGISRLDITLYIQNIYWNSPVKTNFTGDFKNAISPSLGSGGGWISFILTSGEVVNETGRATMIIPGESIIGGKELIVHFITTN